MFQKINSSIDNVLWIIILCIIFQVELSKWRKILLFLLQIDLVQSVLSSLHGFHFTNRRDYFLLASGMQISNGTKVTHLFFFLPK